MHTMKFQIRSTHPSGRSVDVAVYSDLAATSSEQRLGQMLDDADATQAVMEDMLVERVRQLGHGFDVEALGVVPDESVIEDRVVMEFGLSAPPHASQDPIGFANAVAVLAEGIWNSDAFHVAVALELTQRVGKRVRVGWVDPRTWDASELNAEGTLPEDIV